jgi:hypothetical protein
VSPGAGRAGSYVHTLGYSGSSLDTPAVPSSVAVEALGSSKTSPIAASMSA